MARRTRDIYTSWVGFHESSADRFENADQVLDRRVFDMSGQTLDQNSGG
jgi:hypothetical protein